MRELIPTLIICCALAWFSHLFSVRDEFGKYVKREKFLYIVMIIVMACFIGLRTQYNDTGAYIWNFQTKIENPIPFFDYLAQVDWKPGNNPLFAIVNNTLALMHFSVQSMMMFYAFVTMIPILWFIDKYSSNIAFSIYLVFVLELLTFSCAAVKQCVAISIGLIGIDRFLNKKYFRFIIYILIAMMFHPYILLFFLAPLLTFKPWTKKTYWLLLLSIVIGLSLKTLITNVTVFTMLFGDEYNIEDLLSGKGIDIFRFAVAVVPLVLSFIVKNNIPDSDYDKTQCLLMNFCMVFVGIMFVSLFGTAYFFSRVAYYFLVFPIIVLPWLLNYFDPKYKSLVIFAAVILYFAYFYYGYGMSNFFDEHFERITIKEFIHNDLGLL